MLDSPVLLIAAISALCTATALIIYLVIKVAGMRAVLKSCQNSRTRLETLSRSMLEITQAIVGTEKPEDLYELILKKAIEAIPGANVGSVMIKDEDGNFRCIVHQGFDDDKIKDFAIPLEQTILWRYTNGRIEKAVNIGDVTSINNLEIKPLTVDPEEWSIRSTIAVPLMVENSLNGIVHIDSRELNAFGSDDLTAMEYIRSNTETALQKFLLYSRMVSLSRYDSLTKAYNRNFFMERFTAILQKAERYGERFALIIFDIDDLKYVNDNYGHITGDRVLQGFAETTLNLIRKTDTFARWGGDEFMAVFYEIDVDEITEKIERISSSLKENPLATQRGEVAISFSFGHAFYSEEGEDFDELMKIADNRMYINKRENKKQS